MVRNAIVYLRRAILRRRHLSNGNVLGVGVALGKGVSLAGVTMKSHSSVARGASLEASRVGEYSSIGRHTKITHTDIGRYCAVSWDCTINAISHPYRNLTISAFPYVPHVGNFVSERKQAYRRVVIGNDVWIGANSVIMPGIAIGNGAIVGAGAVVTRDVPDYAIVAGVPAKVIGSRFSEDVVEKLLHLKWWDLDPAIIKAHIELFQGELDAAKLEELEALCR